MKFSEIDFKRIAERHPLYVASALCFIIGILFPWFLVLSFIFVLSPLYEYFDSISADNHVEISYVQKGHNPVEIKRYLHFVSRRLFNQFGFMNIEHPKTRLHRFLLKVHLLVNRFLQMHQRNQ